MKTVGMTNSSISNGVVNASSSGFSTASIMDQSGDVNECDEATLDRRMDHIVGTIKETPRE